MSFEIDKHLQYFRFSISKLTPFIFTLLSNQFSFQLAYRTNVCIDCRSDFKCIILMHSLPEILILLNIIWHNDVDRLGCYKLEFMTYRVALCLSSFGGTGGKCSLETEMCEQRQF